MHKSKLAGFIIDCDSADLDAAAAFWAAALGMPVDRSVDAGESYAQLSAPAALELDIEVQRVSHPSRVHLDIETDDIAAEVARLEKLGAKQVGPVKRWVVMEAPTGQRFCVVRAKAKSFEKTANRWG